MRQILLELESLDLKRTEPSKDSSVKVYLDDTRKIKLTLDLLNKLKKVRALDKFERLKRYDLFQVMYAQPSGEEGGGAPF